MDDRSDGDFRLGLDILREGKDFIAKHGNVTVTIEGKGRGSESGWRLGVGITIPVGLLVFVGLIAGYACPLCKRRFCFVHICHRVGRQSEQLLPSLREQLSSLPVPMDTRSTTPPLPNIKSKEELSEVVVDKNFSRGSNSRKKGERSKSKSALASTTPAPVHQSMVRNDGDASNISPVPSSSPSEEPKKRKGPGRPKGSKNKKIPGPELEESLGEEETVAFHFDDWRAELEAMNPTPSTSSDALGGLVKPSTKKATENPIISSSKRRCGRCSACKWKCGACRTCLKASLKRGCLKR